MASSAAFSPFAFHPGMANCGRLLPIRNSASAKYSMIGNGNSAPGYDIRCNPQNVSNVQQAALQTPDAGQ